MDSKDREKDTEEMWASQDNLVPMEADMGLSFDFCLPTPHFFEPHELADVDSSMYVPNEDSLSGLYSCYGDSSSPDGANSCSATTTMMVATAATAKAASKNVISERDRRKRLNEKLYALRGVVPNITKMDKASIIRDAIAYIEQLQEQERQMLAEVSNLESATAAVKTENVVSVGGTEEEGAASPQRKRRRRAPSVSSIIDDALCSADSPPVEILEVQVSEVGEKVAVVSVRCGKARDAMAKVCRALESLRLKVITASVASVAGSIAYTMFVETEGMSGAQVKETVNAALAQLDVTRSSLKPMSYWEY